MSIWELVKVTVQLQYMALTEVPLIFVEFCWKNSKY